MSATVNLPASERPPRVTVRRVAHPSTRLPFVNTPIVHLPERGLVAAVNYSGTGRDCNLFLVNQRTLAVRKHRLPAGEQGAYGFATGSDGRLYLGTFSGSLYRFDPADDSLVVVARPFQTGGEPTGIVWNGLATRRGKVYMGVYPTGAFCEYDIASGALRIVEPMPPRNGLGFYARAFLELPDGNLLVFVGGAKPTLFLYAPDSGAPERIATEAPLPTALSFEGFLDEGHALVSRDGRLVRFDWRNRRFSGDALQDQSEPIVGLARQRGRLYGVSPESGSVYEIREGRALRIEHGLPLRGGRLIQWIPGEEGLLLSLTDNGLFVRFDPDGRRPSRVRQLPNRSRTGMEMSLFAPQPGGDLVVGAHFINMQLFVANRRTGRSRSPGNKVSGHGGQITCGAWMGDQFFFASYGKAVLYRFDPAQPFRQGVNPLLLRTVGARQNRPVAMHRQGDWLYLATKSDYGCLGGAIVAYRPATGDIEVDREFVPDQAPQALFLDPESGRLAGSTGIPGDQGSAVPVATEAVLFVWDTKTRRTLACRTPWKAPYLPATALSPEGVMVGFDAERMYRFDVRSLRCDVRPWAHGRVVCGLFLDGRRLLGAGTGELFLYDLATGAYQPLQPCRETRRMVRLDGRRVLLDHRGVELRELRIDGLGDPS